MANARMISKEFFTSADLTDQPFWLQVLFAGMIVYADDSGVIRDDPVFLRNVILAPSQHRRCPNAAALLHGLDTLVARSVLLRCKLEGVSCFKITNFSKFQRLKRREGKRREDEAEAIATVAARISPLGGGAKPDEVFWRLQQAPFNFGNLKARVIFDTLREPKGATLDAWLAMEDTLGTRGLVAKIQRHAHPDEIPPPKPGKSFADLERAKKDAEFMRRLKEDQHGLA